jgi:ribosomal protein L11 methyltransferase
LALAALLLGARAAVGVDIDSVALAAATRNAAHNGVEARASWRSELPGVKADLVVANLYPGPLSTLAPAICNHVSDGGVLILSGFRAPQRPAIEALYATHGLHVEDAQYRAGWHGLVLRFDPQERP